ncbi:glycosyltransferase [Streptomyces lydicus]|nr:glycosyltransferase [Streptomyces lydicus]
MDAAPFAAVADAPADDSRTLVWVGAIEPAKDLVALLHAFAELRRTEPAVTLRIVGGLGRDPQAPGYLAHCRALAAQLFPDEAADARTVGENPVSFEEIGGPDVPALADAYASATVVVLSSVVEGFPRSLVEAMFCGRATVSTDAGAVCEVIGGTGLVVPPRNPGRSPRRAGRCSATPTAGPGWARRPGHGRSNSSPSSRTSRHFVASTWS